MAYREVDLFVVGAGSGGVRAARIAASYGAKVMIMGTLQRHCEERSDEAIRTLSAVSFLDCFASLAMTAINSPNCSA